MRITNLPTSSSFASNDVLAIEVNGVTYKLTGATLAAAVKSIGNYVTTDDVVTTTTDGLMLSSDKVKLNGIAAGAQVNTITGVKGGAESSYRTGNVNLTPTNVGAVAKSGDTMTGDLQFTSNITPATAPSSTTSVSRVACLDADGNVISILRTTHTNSGAIEAKVIARRIISGNTVLNELGPTINADGSLGYKITDAEAFRTAAGAFAAANVYNGLDKTASGFALDARQGKALKDTQTKVGNGAFALGSIAAGTSKVLQCSTSSHAMLILTGPSIDLMGLYLIRIGANDVPNTVTVTQGSKITFTPATGKITIGNTSTGSMAVNVIPLSRDSSYFSLT